MPESYAEQLDRVQRAIAKIEEGGQEVAPEAGLRLRRADLQTLYRREAELQRLVRREANGGGLGVSYVTPE